jgi:ketopantoate reductase
MTDDEKKRMLLMVRAVESLFAETCALKTALAAHRISENSWKPLVKKLLAEPVMGPVHAKFQRLYDEIEQTPDESRAFEELLQALPKPKKEWN